jgi:hypothetical protein
MLVIRRGVNFDATIDTYTDTTNTTRISYAGSHFAVRLQSTGCADIMYATTDTDPALTVTDATNPTGQHLVLHLDATQTTAIIPSSGVLTVLRLDPDDVTDVDLIAGPTSFIITVAP